MEFYQIIHWRTGKIHFSIEKDKIIWYFNPYEVRTHKFLEIYYNDFRTINQINEVVSDKTKEISNWIHDHLVDDMDLNYETIKIIKGKKSHNINFFVKM
jgi:hypothetical protein